jgi:hypothetical protein
MRFSLTYLFYVHSLEFFVQLSLIWKIYLFTTALRPNIFITLLHFSDIQRYEAYSPIFS